MTDEEKLRRGQRAKQILEDPLFVEAVEKVDAALIRTWRQSHTQDAEGRERVYYQLRSMNEILKYLTTQMETGKIVAMRLEKSGSDERADRGT